MKKIKLTQGKYAIVDDEDYPYLKRFSWCIRSDVEKNRLDKVVTFIGFYKEKSLFVSMGKFLVENKDNDKFVILHKNGNHFDFRKTNLLLGTFSEKKIRDGKYSFKERVPTSKYKGVYKKKKRTPGHKKVWTATVSKEGTKYHLGNFNTEKEAAEVYNERAKELYGDLAYQNKI